MICSICKKGETSVVDSRPTEDGTAIRRRRLCVCGARFTTFERVQFREIMVIKKNGRKSSFDRDKLRDALAATEMQTFYGNIKFGPGGQNTAKPMILFQVRCKGDDCENKVVAPTKWASDKFYHPMPKWSERS